MKWSLRIDHCSNIDITCDLEKKNFQESRLESLIVKISRDIFTIKNILRSFSIKVAAGERYFIKGVFQKACNDQSVQEKDAITRARTLDA